MGGKKGFVTFVTSKPGPPLPPGLDPLRMLRGGEVAKGALGGRRLCPGGPGSLDQAERLEGAGGLRRPVPCARFPGVSGGPLPHQGAVKV